MVNAVLHAVMVALIEAGAMATKLGLPMQTLVDILKREEGLMRPLTHRVQERIMQGNYAGGMSVSNARKDSTWRWPPRKSWASRSMPSWPHIRPMRSLRRLAWGISITRPWRRCGSNGRGCGSPRRNLTPIDVDRRTRLVYSGGMPMG